MEHGLTGIVLNFCGLSCFASDLYINWQKNANGDATLFSGLVTAHETDALRGVGHVIFPVVFVFDGNVAGEILAFQFKKSKQKPGE